MCIGIPMQVIEMRETHALCEANGKKELIDMILVGDQVPGTWILNFLGGAREVLTPDNAKQISQALSALDQIMNGEIGGMSDNQEIDSLFADIIEDGPRLPPHLQAQAPYSPSQPYEIVGISNPKKNQLYEKTTGTLLMPSNTSKNEPTPSPLIDRLSQELNYPVLDLDNIDSFLATHEYSVLFFTEDIKRFPETNDVAVVLPELMNVFPNIHPAIINRKDEKKLQSLYGFRSWPALVFMHKEKYLDAITGIQDWSDYLTQIKSILTSEPSRPLSIGVPVVSS